MKHLWINADDLGFTPAVSDGICEALLQGIVTTTTAMVCSEGALEILPRYALQIPGRIGLHFQLTDGAPRSPLARVPSLVNGEGRFPRHRSGIGRVDPREVEQEWEAQLVALRGLGIEPTHLDSHHHVHRLPGVFEAYAGLARRHGLPARGGSPEQTLALLRHGVPTADVFSQEFCRGTLAPGDLLAAVDAAARQCPEGGIIELMCHPGRVDEALHRRSIYVEERERELETLCSADLPARLEKRGIALLKPPEVRSLGVRVHPS